jgi:hypothetical protein
MDLRTPNYSWRDGVPVVREREVCDRFPTRARTKETSSVQPEGRTP